jgi:hypothetical protein
MDASGSSLSSERIASILPECDMAASEVLEEVMTHLAKKGERKLLRQPFSLCLSAAAKRLFQNPWMSERRWRKAF